jgi:hypothetical protein
VKKLNLLTLLFIVVSLSACYYDNEEQLYPNSGSTCDTVNIKYTGSIQLIINAKCATQGCHVAGSQSPDLGDYQKVVSNITRVKVRAIDEKSMPAAGPLSACEINKLTAWINGGTPQ